MGYYTSWRGNLLMTNVPNDELEQKINGGQKYFFEPFLPFGVDHQLVVTYDGSLKTYNWQNSLLGLLKLLGENDIYATGTFTWEGEENGDYGKVEVTRNEATVCRGIKAYDTPEPLEGYRGR